MCASPQNLLRTLLYSLPALGNVGAVLLLFLFIFTILGMNLFGNIKLQDNSNGSIDRFYVRTANFRTFPVGMLTLFRFTTGENWNGMMEVSHTIHLDGCLSVA